MNERPDARALLEHAHFLRALSRSLLAGHEQDAEDNVQQAFLAALEHPPRPGNLRGWLAVVARRLAFRSKRTAMRRMQREHGAARPETMPAADGVAGQLELQRKVVEAVTALPEPYRSTIVLRYFHEQPPARIAKDQAVSVETVKTRLKRALARLRGDLDHAHAGDRRAWSLGLAAFLAGSTGAASAAAKGPASAATTTTSTSLSAKAAAAVLLACVAATVLVVRATRDEPPRRTRADEARAPAPAVAEEKGEAAEGAASGRDANKGTRESGTGEASEAAGIDHEAGAKSKRSRPRTTGPAPPSGVVTARVSLEGAPSPAGARVTLESGDEVFEAQADESGDVRFERLAPGPYKLCAAHSGHAASRLSFTLEPEEGAGRFELYLRRGGTILVTVKGSGGAPVPDEEIRLYFGVLARTLVRRVKTDRAGRARLEDLAPGTYALYRGAEREHQQFHFRAEVRPDGTIVRVPTPQTEVRTTEVLAGKTTEVEFDIACGIRGTVSDARGEPVGGATIYLYPARIEKRYRAVDARTGDDGRYELQGFPAGEYEIQVQLTVDGLSCGVPCGRVRVFAGQMLDHPIRLSGGTLSGRVACGEGGGSLPGLSVQAMPVELDRQGNHKRMLGWTVSAFCNAEGRYRFHALPSGTYRLWVPSPKPQFADAKRLLEIAEGADHTADFTLLAVRLGTLRLRVLEPEGAPARRPDFWIVTDEGWHRTLRASRLKGGFYEFELEVGARAVVVSCTGFEELKVDVTVEANKTAERTVRLRAAKEQVDNNEQEKEQGR